MSNFFGRPEGYDGVVETEDRARWRLWLDRRQMLYGFGIVLALATVARAGLVPDPGPDYGLRAALALFAVVAVIDLDRLRPCNSWMRGSFPALVLMGLAALAYFGISDPQEFAMAIGWIVALFLAAMIIGLIRCRANFMVFRLHAEAARLRRLDGKRT